MRRLALFAAILGLVAVAGSPAAAQEDVFLSLSAESAVVQTGQIYEVQIGVENAVDLWVADVEIAYDPDQVYVFGTKAGSPVAAGPLLMGEIVAPRNRVGGGLLEYTVSLLAPAEPINGAGTLATFQVYPLRAGEIQFTFRRASLMRVSFQQTAEGRIPDEPQPQPFMPVLLHLTAQGETVPAPDEVTATPPPTSTPIADDAAVADVATITVEPTLVNITRAPATATIAVPDALPVPPAAAASPALIVALVLVALTGIGLMALLVIYLRRYRR